MSLMCPCGSQNAYAKCCGPYLDTSVDASQIAPTAEALMRSRYTAYTMLREDYLLSTWHQSTRPTQLSLDKETATKWLGLDIKRHETAANCHIAIVEFVARYKIGGGRAGRLHEISNFIFEDKRWFYVDGEIK
jgi:SEC-C motif domain protein